MTYQKRVLCAAVVAGLGLASTGASAATVDLGATTIAPIKVANSIPANTTTLGGGGEVIRIKTATGYNGFVAKTTNPVYVKFNLTNGAKFSTDQTLVMSCSGLSGSETETTAGDVGIQAGGGGFDNVTFIVTAVSGSSGAFGASAYCTLSAGTALTIATGFNNVNVSATFEFTNGLSQGSAAGGNGTLISFVNAFTATIDGGTATTALVDATSGSDNWVLGNNKTQATAVLGSLSMDVGVATALTATLAGNITLAEALSTGSITISGPAVQALKTVASSRGLFLSDAAGCADANIATAYASTATNSVTFNNVTPAQLTSTAFICGMVSGNTTQISTGQLTAQVGGTAASNVTITFPAAGNIQNVGTNGTTKNAFLMHNSTSTTKTSVVRVINNGANAGQLFATAYDGAGNVCGTAGTSLGSINVGQMLTFTSANLQTTLGCTPTNSTDKYRIVFFGGLTSFKVLNHAKDTTGTGFTLSQSQDD